MKQRVDLVIIVLVYKNYNDLVDLIKSANKLSSSHAIVVVNSDSDEQSNKEIKEISIKYKCSFIQVENKGYSYGNHKGIEYANRHYCYKYLIISNPDITIETDIQVKQLKPNGITAPTIIAKNGKRQNPLQPRKTKTADYFIYSGFKNNIMLLCYLGIIIKKIKKSLYLAKLKVLPKTNKKIYAAHGSFIIFSADSLNALKMKPFDEGVFLFAEESILAHKANKLKINVVYNPTIIVNHKEDGSMRLSRISTRAELCKSNIYYYEKYIKQIKK